MYIIDSRFPSVIQSTKSYLFLLSQSQKPEIGAKVFLNTDTSIVQKLEMSLELFNQLCRKNVQLPQTKTNHLIFELFWYQETRKKL